MNYGIIRDFRHTGSWKKLEEVALDLVRSAESRANSAMNPILGGGTRIMLAYEHRISHDIDLFIRDPQWISFLTPRLNDDFGQFPVYDEASNFLKIKLKEGEIDFIVSMSLLNLPPQVSDDSAFALEPVAEVLAKKLFYRGASLTARDIFDWWYVGNSTPDVFPAGDIQKLLGERIQGVTTSIANLQVSKPAKAVWETLITKEKPSFQEALKWAEDQLNTKPSARFRLKGP
jgi:hypothetical protein